VHTALTEQHLYVGFMRLGIEVVNQKDGQINFFSNYHCGNFGIPAQWP
jgi:hypothetical protein